MKSAVIPPRRKLLKKLAMATAGFSLLPFSSKLFASSLFPNKKKDSSFNINSFGIHPQKAHQIWQNIDGNPKQLPEVDVVIVGSGISALSAARHLYQSNIKNFKILEAESFLGGNAATSQFAISACGWGSHYLPILSDTSDFLQEFLAEENIITHFNPGGIPYYNDLYLCHDLKERLYINGHWQKGIVPFYGVPKGDLDEIERFEQHVDKLKFTKGNDGRYAFCIPIAKSSQDPTFLKLEQITMAEYLSRHNFNSSFLLWYVNYCCRDDFGVGIESVSAWAGLHYFASRRSLAANAETESILTWPEGNGFLAQRLAKPYINQVYHHALVYNILEQSNHVKVKYLNIQENQTYEIPCQKVILAVPEFSLNYLLKETDISVSSTYKDNYSPWIVANCVVNRNALDKQSECAWDNVSFYNRSLGYVHARHQCLQTNTEKTIITYYRPLDDHSPQIERTKALNRTLADWHQFIIKDLNHIHPKLEQDIHRIDVRLYGHGMCRPIPNYIWGHAQKRSRQLTPNIFVAHSDLSGISLFEEAFWQGLQTAQQVKSSL